MKNNKVVDETWDRVLDDFEVWYEKESQSKYCAVCENTEYPHPEWEDQLDQLFKLVKKHFILTPKGKK